MSILSVDLNRAILKLAPKFEAKDVAPDSLELLIRNSTSTLAVWSGASDSTIYGYASVNHAMRAWHDSLHIKLNAPFTLQGETLVALEQASLLQSDNLGDIIMAEVVGQAEHFAKYGEFPINQTDFIKSYLKGSL